MKKQFPFYRNLLLSAACVLLIIVSCKKTHENVQKEPENHNWKYTTPTTFVSLTYGDIDAYNRTIAFIAKGMAALGQRDSTIQTTDFRRAVEAETEGEEAKIAWLVQHLEDSLFHEPSAGGNNDFGDALTFMIDYLFHSGSFSFIPSDWNVDKTEGFIFNNICRSTLVRIPEVNSLSLSVRNRPLLVIPNLWLQYGIKKDFPQTGFYYDQTDQTVKEFTFATEDDYDDQVAWYIWHIDTEICGLSGSQAGGTGQGQCTGDYAAICGDGYCDSLCGETWPPCIDCHPDRNKILKLKSIKILEDDKKVAYSGQRWREVKEGGSYEIAYSVIVVHQNNKTDRIIEDRIWQDVKRSDILNCKRNIWGNVVCDGDNTAQYGDLERWEYNTTKVGNFRHDPKDCIFSEHFNPKKDYIYILFYEYDEDGFGKSCDVYTGKDLLLSPPINVGSLAYVGDPDVTGVPFGTKDHFTVNHKEGDGVGGWNHVVQIRPNDWKDWAIDTVVPPSMTYAFNGTNWGVSYGMAFELQFENH